MASKGFLIGSATSVDVVGGDNNWTNEDYVLNINSVEKSANWDEIVTPGESMDTLRVTGFDFSIPDNATIIGVEAQVKHKITGFYNVVGLINIIIDNKGTLSTSKTTPVIITSYRTDTLGGSSDLWGEASMLVSHINSSAFGVTYKGDQSEYNSEEYWVDFITLKVYYTEEGPGHKVIGGGSAIGGGSI